MNIQANKKTVWLSVLVLSAVFFSLWFVRNNEHLYEQPIAEIVEATPEGQQEVTETINNVENNDVLFEQTLVGELKNGAQEGQQILLNNSYSASGALDYSYEAGDKLFVSIEEETGQGLIGRVEGPKRDTYIVIAAWLFIFIVLGIGRKSGWYSLVSLGMNVVLLLIALRYYTQAEDADLLLICSGLVLVFTVLSLFLISGNNKKTYTAILATLTGTFVSLLITYVVMRLTGEKGLRYEEMAFITRNPQEVFLASILVGSLGAVMDIAITITSSLYELDYQNNAISLKDLRASGLEIGKDIMGTMTNVLLFTYVSGSIPMMLLYLKNGSPIGYTFSMNLSLEVTRALVGSIGIVLTIPISIFLSLYFIRRRRLVK